MKSQISKKLKCTDLGYLVQRTKNNSGVIMEMISAYLEQTPPLILAMKQSLQDKNWDMLHSAAHKMIPSFSIMGISADFESMAKKIQEYARTRQQEGELQEMILQIEQCMHAGLSGAGRRVQQI
jgi:HPt (histidine-containing phosphotransfer) domain-containing protein